MKKRLIHIYTLTIRLCAPAFTLSALSALGAMLVLLAGCIHQYPDDGQAADVTLRVQLLPERELILLPPITKGGAAVLPEGCLPRVTVEARPADGSGAEVVRTVTALSAEELSQPLITLPVPLKLKAVPYRFTVWADYTRGASLPDTYYNTENFRSVSHTLPYEEDYLRREDFFGNASADLAGEEWRDGIQITVKRPLAHYRIVATDVQEFLNKQQANGRPGAGEYEVNIIYAYFLVTHLDAVTGQPLNSGAGFSYTRSINLSEDMTECELAADYILADEQGSGVTVTVEVREKGVGKAVLSRSSGLEIPYRRWHTTTVTGRFLTAGSGGGGGSSSGGIDIGIDGDYDGEINIDARN